MLIRVEVARDLPQLAAPPRMQGPASSGAATATVGMPSRSQVRKIRAAISPRFATRSFRISTGRPLLEEGAKPVLPLGARAPLGGPVCHLRDVRALPDEALRLASRDRACLEQLSDHAVDSLVEVGCDLMDEADPESGRGIESLPGQEVAPRRAGPDPGQDERRDDGGHDAEPDFGEREDGVLRRDRNVDAGQETRAAAERMALNPSDDGRRTGVDRLEHGVEAHCVLDVVVVVEVDRGTLPVHVGSGAKARPLALEPDHARISDVGESPRRVPRSEPRRTHSGARGAQA